MAEQAIEETYLPKEVHVEFAALVEDCEFRDNFRFARKGNFVEEAWYENWRRDGCCGSCDVELVDATGQVWLVGCNYGH